jgi:hypothetical protein
MTALPEDARAAGDWREAGYLAAAATAIAAIVAVEAALVVPGHLLAAQIADAVLVFLLVNAGPRSAAQPPTARAATGLAVLRALALVPLIRVVALGLPMRDWSEPAAVIAIALPVGLVALRLAPLVGLRLGRLFGAPSPVDLYALAAGGGLGLVACLSGAPSLWPDGAGSGRIGMLAAAGLFSATYLDAGSAALVLSFALAGVVFSHVVSISGSLPGVMLAHVLLVLGAGAIWPSLLDHPAADLDTQGTVIALAIAIAVAAALACLHPLKQAPAQRGGDER